MNTRDESPRWELKTVEGRTVGHAFTDEGKKTLERIADMANEHGHWLRVVEVFQVVKKEES